MGAVYQIYPLFLSGYGWRDSVGGLRNRERYDQALARGAWAAGTERAGSMLGIGDSRVQRSNVSKGGCQPMSSINLDRGLACLTTPGYTTIRNLLNGYRR